MDERECVFKKYLTSCSVDKTFADSSLTEVRKRKVVESSVKRDDDLQTYIENTALYYHSLCYMAYTSKEKIERHNKRKAESTISDCGPVKSRRYS